MELERERDVNRGYGRVHEWKRRFHGRERSVGGRGGFMGGRGVWEEEECGREKSVGGRGVWEEEECGKERSVGGERKMGGMKGTPTNLTSQNVATGFSGFHNSMMSICACMKWWMDGWMDEPIAKLVNK